MFCSHSVALVRSFGAPSPLLGNIRVMVIVWRLRALSEQLCDGSCDGLCDTMFTVAANVYEQFLQVQQIGFVTLGPLCCA